MYTRDFPIRSRLARRMVLAGAGPSAAIRRTPRARILGLPLTKNNAGGVSS